MTGFRHELSPLAAALLFLGTAGAALAQAPTVTVAERGAAYVDPASGNKVWSVTDGKLCPGGAKHFYSYWPVWNQDGTHLIVACLKARGEVVALLMKDSNFSVTGDALAGAPPGINPERLFWSWTDKDSFYGYRDLEIWKWNPFTRKGKRIFRLDKSPLPGRSVAHLTLGYVSFDDRYLLITLLGATRPGDSEWTPMGLATYDMQTGQIVGALEVAGQEFDEAVFARDNRVWVIMGKNSYTYTLDFSSRIRSGDHGHHAHGVLPNGRTVTVVEESSRSCPPGSKSGNPAAKDYPNDIWKPTAAIIDPDVETAGTPLTKPLKSQIFMIGCGIPGQHGFAHFSWNNAQKDQFFVSSEGYGNTSIDPLAHSILRVTLKFDPRGRIVGDAIDVLAKHRSNVGLGYYYSPRASCNQQGSRCLFASSMTVGVLNPVGVHQLYVVDVPVNSQKAAAGPAGKY